MDSANKSEEEVKAYLKQIQDASSDRGLAAANFLFRALLPKKDGPTQLVEWYTWLRQSKDYYQTALSLVTIVVEEACPNKDKLDLIQEYMRAKKKFETEKSVPEFILRRMLCTVLNELSDDQLEELIQEMTSQHLDVHPDRFRQDSSDSYVHALRILESMQEKCLVQAEDRNLTKLRGFLVDSRPDLVKKILDSYDPNQIQNLFVMDVDRILALESPPSDFQDIPAKDRYRYYLVKYYTVMSVIPFNQWPPIEKELFVSLALITNESMSRHDTFSRSTIRGSVDDVYKKKVKAGIDDVFPKTLPTDKRWLVLIEGRPGSGKSTLATKVSKDWGEGKRLQDIELLILVRLRRFLGKKDVSFEDVFGVYCDNASVVSKTIDEIKQTEGKGVCFILDGLDEYSSAIQPGNLIHDLIFGLKLPKASVFMTSRPAGSHRLRNSTRLQQNVEIVGFLDDEVEKYIKEYYNDQPGKAEDLLKYLRSHPNVARMCYLPLHIAMIVYLHKLVPHTLPRLPNTETELYKMFVLHTLLRSLQREITNPDDMDDIELHEFIHLPKQKRPIFKDTCHLAFKATLKQKQIFTGKEILESNSSLVVPTKKEFDSMGLLTVDRMPADSSLPTKTFSFLHLTVQEFLSAVYLVDYLDQDKQLKKIEKHSGKVHMRIVWKFYSGLSTLRNKNEFFIKAFKMIIAQNASQGLARLSMIHCAFESKEKQACSDVLAQLSGTVNMEDVSLTPSDCAAIGFVAIRASTDLRVLDLSYSHLGPPGVNALVQELQTSDEPLSNLKELRMRARTDFKPVGTEGAPALVKLLERMPNLGELRLYGNKLKTEKFKLLVPPITKMGQLHTLILSRNDLDTTAGEHVSQILAHVPLLHTFYISYNPLKDEGLGAMKPGLLKCLNLKILGLRGTHMTEGSGIHLKEIFEKLPKLEWAELYQNSLSDKGVIDMLPGLFKAKSLKILSLVENGITDKGAVAFAAYLRFTDTLSVMRMYYNHDLTEVGKIALRTAVVERLPSKCELKFAV